MSTRGPGPGPGRTGPRAARPAHLQACLERYLEALARWGERTNLVGSTDRASLEVHVEDSLAAAPHLPSGARVVDLGSGAGFPGIPLAIARPDLRLTLVEIRERRVHFLRHVVRRLELECAVERARLEQGPAERFDVALLRAVARPERALPLAVPWVVAGGEIWIWTRSTPEELGYPCSGRIPLDQRGAILRIPAAAVSRGTP